MKGLLHSKRFKANLCKWLCMYVGVLLLLTTVVTYSKFINSFRAADNSQSAKFDVKVDYDKDKLTCTDAKDCYSGTFRPTAPLEYTFTVDTSDLEANALFVLTLTVDKDFKVLKLEDITNNNEITLSNDEKDNKKPISISSKIRATEGSKTTYKIKVLYNKPINKDTTFAEKLEIVKVGYSAKQIEV